MASGVVTGKFRRGWLVIELESDGHPAEVLMRVREDVARDRSALAHLVQAIRVFIIGRLRLEHDADNVVFADLGGLDDERFKN